MSSIPNFQPASWIIQGVFSLMLPWSYPQLPLPHVAPKRGWPRTLGREIPMAVGSPSAPQWPAKSWDFFQLRKERYGCNCLNFWWWWWLLFVDIWLRSVTGICVVETNSVYEIGTQCCKEGSNDSLSLSPRCFEWASETTLLLRNDVEFETIGNRLDNTHSSWFESIAAFNLSPCWENTRKHTEASFWNTSALPACDRMPAPLGLPSQRRGGPTNFPDKSLSAENLLQFMDIFGNCSC